MREREKNVMRKEKELKKKQKQSYDFFPVGDSRLYWYKKMV